MGTLFLGPMRLTFLPVLAIILHACSTTSKLTELDRVADMMTGSFASTAQAEADSAFFDIRLEMAPIWQEREEDIHWLYVEQAVAGYLDQPYRQRVYKLSQDDDGRIRSEVYTLREPLRFAGAFRQDEPLANLTPDSLTWKEGCAILLAPQEDGSYMGSTGDRTCPSTLRGSSWATSEVTLEAQRMISWDRGWDQAGEQVWGAVKGGYVFDKKATD